MKVTVISDTHNKHHLLKLKRGDLLIHAGDISGKGTKIEIEDFLKWFSGQPFKYKIFIAGNHDFFFEEKNKKQIEQLIPENMTYLNDSGVEVEGIKIWGSPVQPWFYDWAFNRKRGLEIKKHWDLIPLDTNILVTHGPAFGVLDKTTRGDHAGCLDLKNVIDSIKPDYHICGHIHEAYGVKKNESTTYINASILNERYQLVNKAFEFEIFPK